MNKYAEKGKTVFICVACGKRSNDMYGEDKISPGWDESCMLNSVEVYIAKLVMSGGRVVQVLDGGLVEPPKERIAKPYGDKKVTLR